MLNDLITIWKRLMASDAYSKFKASMNIGYEQWHDGIGYDLDALRAMTPAEKKSVAALLAGRDDWRDVEALAALHEGPAQPGDADSAELVGSLEAMSTSKRGDTRAHAMEYLHGIGKLSDAQLEARLLEELRIVEIGDGLTNCFHLIDRVPTERIKRRLLWCMMNRPKLGALFAGKLWQLCGKSDEDFDWSMRPLFLTFGEGHSPWETHNAGQEFCAAVAMKPEDAE